MSHCLDNRDNVLCLEIRDDKEFLFMQSPPIEITDLIIDRTTRPDSFEPTICLNLEGTLLSITRPQKLDQVAEEFTFHIQRHHPHEDFFVTIRPGAVELMDQLYKYALPFFYSDLPRSDILDITHSLYMQEHLNSDWADKLASCFANIAILSRENCSITPSGPKKLLGNLSEELDCPINHVWLIDRPDTLVDFRNKLISVPEFDGDLSDQHLYDLIGKIFIN